MPVVHHVNGMGVCLLAVRLSRHLGQLTSELEQKLVNLYYQVYSYQIRIIHHYGGGKLGRLVKDLAGTNVWKEMMVQIENDSQQIDAAVSTLAHDTVLRTWKTLEDVMGCAEEIKAFQEATLSATEVSKVQSSSY